MIITLLAGRCTNSGEFYNAAPYIDLALSAALLTIGLLGQYGTLPIGSASGPLVGAGGFYLGHVLLTSCSKKINKDSC